MIKIRNNFIFSNNHRPIIIAEVSANHCGSKKLFLKLIEKAHFAGADAVKIQSYEPDDITLNSKTESPAESSIKRGASARPAILV